MSLHLEYDIDHVRRAAARVFSGLTAAALAVSVVLIARHLQYRARITQSTLAEVVALTEKAAQDVDAVVKPAMDRTAALAAELSSRRLTEDEISERLRKIAEENPTLYGESVLFEPFAFRKDRRLFAPYWNRKGGRLQRVQIETLYDYTAPEQEFYSVPIKKGAMWVAPFYGRASGTLVAIYSVPFTLPGETKPSGLVTAVISLDEIRKIVEGLDLGPSGFGAVTTGDGVYLYHPNNEYVIARKTVFELGKEHNDKDRLVMGESARKGEGGMLAHRSTTTGLDSWLIYRPVPSSGWSLQNTFIRQDIPIDVDKLRHQLIWIFIALGVFAISAAVMGVALWGKTSLSLWAISGVTAAVFLFGVAFMWHVALTMDKHEFHEGDAVSDKATLARTMKTYVETCEARHTEPPVFVPTGLLIESMRFAGASDVVVTGYVWQKYDVETQAGLTCGFTIRGAGDAKITEVLRVREGPTEIVRWFIQATLHPNMNFPEYPLDREELSIKLQHQDLNHNVVLVPDLAAYRVLSPTALPGLEKGSTIPGWRIIRTFFEFRKDPVSTNFGVTQTVAKENFPSFYFDVIIRRNLLDAFISNLGPMIVSILLLFALQMVVTSDEKLASFMQTTAGRVMAICVSMFFVIVFSHIDVRRKVAAQELFYLEYFYFATYWMILWVALNSILFTRVKGLRFIQYRDCFIPKLLFWPLLTGALCAVSTWTFY